MIEIQSVSKRYGKRQALDALSVQINPGEVTLLLGANGAGKSTLLRCLLGITDFEGTIRVGGLNPLADGRTVRALVGYMPQSGGLHPDLSVLATTHLYADIRRVSRARCEPLLKQAGLDGHTHVAVGDLSGGLRQRLGFALALLADPQILILDEPTSSLDAASRDWLAATLRAQAADGRTVLVSTHAGQELLAAGDRRIVLEEGRLVSDSRSWPVAAASRPKPPAQTSSGSVLPLIRKELADALGNRWLISYAVALAVLGCAAASTGIHSSSGLALQAFGRTTATLMNLCLLLSPLVAVLMGAASIAGERERGTLDHLLAQPITRSGLLLAKHAGLLVSLTLATTAGFVPAGVLIARSAGPAVLGHYLLFPAVAALVGAAMAAVGLLVSVSSRSAAQAQGAAISVWFGFVLLYDLVLMGSLAINGMSVEFLSAALLANPVDAARVLGVLSLEPDLYLLGPAGAYLAAQFSRGGAATLLLGALALWAAAPLLVAVIRFRLRVPHIRKPVVVPIVSTGEVKVS
jgi:ABC-type multidrug transport system ATPase subunit/ABC-type transport system involved in multi-copper enzyme maturation permease subunit